MELTGNYDRMDGVTIAEYRCPRDGHVRWDVPSKASEYTDQVRFSGLKGRRVA